jgi:hypothetical protein
MNISTGTTVIPDAHEGNVEDWNLILENSKRKAPSPMERERMMLDALFGRSPSGRAGRPTDQAAARLGDTATIPNAERGL